MSDLEPNIYKWTDEEIEKMKAFNILKADDTFKIDPLKYSAMSMDEIIAMQKENAELKAENELIKTHFKVLHGVIELIQTSKVS